MGDLISRLQGDRVTLWRPDVKKQHRTRAPLDQKVILCESQKQWRWAWCKVLQLRYQDIRIFEGFFTDLASFSWCGSIKQALWQFWSTAVGTGAHPPGEMDAAAPGWAGDPCFLSHLHRLFVNPQYQQHFCAGALFTIYKADPTLRVSSRIDGIYLQLAYVLWMARGTRCCCVRFCHC